MTIIFEYENDEEAEQVIKKAKELQTKSSKILNDLRRFFFL